MNNKTIFTVEDPEKRIIYFQKETWDHIRVQHPEMRTSIQQIKSIVKEPDFITEIKARTSLAYTKISSISLYYNVYTKMDDAYKEGQVSTAHITTKPPKGETIWYRKA